MSTSASVKYTDEKRNFAQSQICYVLPWYHGNVDDSWHCLSHAAVLTKSCLSVRKCFTHTSHSSTDQHIDYNACVYSWDKKRCSWSITLVYMISWKRRWHCPMIQCVLYVKVMSSMRQWGNALLILSTRQQYILGNESRLAKMASLIDSFCTTSSEAMFMLSCEESSCVSDTAHC